MYTFVFYSLIEYTSVLSKITAETGDSCEAIDLSGKFYLV